MTDLVAVESPTRVSSTYLGAALKRQLYPTVFCYHGCVARHSQVLTFREAIADLRAHVGVMLRAGYKFLLPSEYQAWIRGEVEYDQPVTCLHFDDGLESVNLIVPWLIKNNIPCGLALITRRQRKHTPDTDFLSWSQISQWVSTGLVEVLYHTHNLHHLAIIRDPDSGILDVAPILEGPCWVDDGDYVYQEPGETRWYWDFSQLDDIALAIPLWGTDPYDETTPLQTTINLVPKATGSVEVLRFWMALSRPYGAGYNANVEIRANGSLVWSGTIVPKNYSTRSQWVEREFYSLELDTPFAVTSGVALALEFTTLNVGVGVALVYGIPTQDDSNFFAVTNCQGLFLEGSQGPPYRYWQYIDYPAGDRYPLKPAIVLGFGTGADATNTEYTGYVTDDINQFKTQVTEWLHATWQKIEVWTAPVKYFWAPYFVLVDEPIDGATPYINGVPTGWDNPNRVEAIIPIKSPTTITVDALQFEFSRPENFDGGDANPYKAGWPPNPTYLNFIHEAENRSFTCTFRFHIGDSPTGPWTLVGLGQIYPMIRKRAFDCSPFVLTANVTRYFRIEPINGGPTVGTEQKCRWPVIKLFCLSRTGNATADITEQVIYPFGAYYSDGTGVIQERPGFTDIGSILKGVFTSEGFKQGYTIQAYRNTRNASQREPDLRRTEWALGRWIAYGDQASQGSLNNLAALSGFLFRDVPHRGVKFQVSLEADPLGNATIRKKYNVLDFVAFDAWAFDGAGGIESFPINDGGTYDGDVYADDKDFLQSRGVRCLLILNNNLGTGEPDSDIASHVVNNPSIYIPLIVAIAVDDGWDGITCNLEAIPSIDRAAATEFYKQLGRAMHVAGKILHATVPAITGTTYDADFWTGWCDLYEIIKSVDAVKVMSYTESGPGTNPGPAAPQYFWDAVYTYIRTIIPEPYWRRVLCGCRAFGHIWDTVAGTTNYITYHQGIAEGLNYAKRLDERDTEIGWGTSTIKAWFGTPHTVDRAQQEAVAGFEGIGLWKLDDGDIEEFFPDHIQIGRLSTMSFLDVRFPETVSLGSSGGPAFNTGLVTAQSGHEFRNARWDMPLHRYDATFAVRDQAQWEAVRNLFMVSRGKARTFRYRDWADYKVTGQIIGLSDGLRTTFQCFKEYVSGAYSLTRLIYLPIAGTVHVFRNDVEIVGGWTLNYLTGLISFAAPPAAGIISWTGEFDVHARFDTDSLPAEILTANGDETNYTPNSIPIVEVRELP